MFHCSYITLQRYLAGDLNWFMTWYCRRHLAHCSACSFSLEQAKKEMEEQKDFCASMEQAKKDKQEITRILTRHTENDDTIKH